VAKDLTNGTKKNLDNMNKKLNVIDQAITQIEEKIINSRTDDVTTRRTGDYRIGLNEAKNILEGLRAMHKQEMKEMYLKGIENYDPTFKRKDNETYGGNKCTK
jgi:hypothetical protein